MRRWSSPSLFVVSGILAVVAVGILPLHHVRPARPWPHDKPAAMSAWFLSQRAFPKGSIPSDWYERARVHLAGMPGTSLRRAARAEWEWLSLGPTNIAGRVRSLAMDPTRPDILYAGSAGGGVWKTVDGGLHWTPQTDLLPNLRIGSIVVDPHRPDRVFAGCGEGFVSWQGMQAFGQGVYRTDDGGEHWELLASTKTADFSYVFDLAADPHQANALLASTNRGIYLTTDGGSTWKRVVVGSTDHRGMQCVYHSSAAGVVYGVIEGVGIFRSLDHGASWTLVYSGSSLDAYTRVVLAPAPSNGDIVYAAFSAEYDETCAGLLKSTDRGTTWTPITIPTNRFEATDYMGWQGQYNSVLAVHPTTPSTIWVGGIDLYRSTNGGQSWTQMTNWYEGAGLPYVHADQHALLFHPLQPGRMVSANDGGIFVTTNGGSTWLDRNSGLVTAQFHSGTPHPTADMVLGGTIDNGNLRITTGTSWMDVTGGDGGYTAVDPTNPSTWYSELYYLHFMRSTAGGADGTWQVKMSGIPRASDYGTTDPVNFIAPFEMDPVNPKVLYAGTNRVYKTTNGADSWKSISPVLSGSGVISALGLSASDSKVVYAGGDEGSMDWTSDGGTSWTSITTGLPVRYITDLAVDPANPRRAFASVSGFGSGHLYRTNPTTMVWENISGAGATALPDAPANCVLVHPTVPDRIFVGTDVGLFYTTNGGGDWMPMNAGIGNVTIADLQIRKDGVLFVATHGRGMYRSATSVLDSTPLAEPADFAMEQNMPNPVRPDQVSTTIRYTVPRAGEGRLMVYDARGSLVREIVLHHPAPGIYAQPVSVATLAAGVYHYTIQVEGRRLPVRKMLVIR